MMMKILCMKTPPNKSKETRDLAIEQKVQGNWEKCEELMEEALRMIRKPYPTE